MKTFDLILDKGKDIKQLSRDLVEHFRNLMIIRVGGKALGRLVDYPVAIKEMFLKQTEKFTLSTILESIDAFIEAQEVSRITENLRTPLEISFAKLTYTEEPINKEESSKENIQDKTDNSENNEKGKKSENTKLFSNTGLLGNKKGQVNTSSNDEEKADTLINSEDVPLDETDDCENVDSQLTIERIKKIWDKLTYAVSREKMSIATYLQEGRPVELEGEKLTIAFSKEHEFHKETLCDQESVKMVEKVISETLNRKIYLKYITIEDIPKNKDEEDDPSLRAALEKFNGKVINKWHKE